MESHEQWYLISAYIDGELSSDERSALDDHLKACASCRMELRSLEKTKRMAAAAPRHALPPDMLERFERSLPRRPWSRRLADWLRPPGHWVPLGTGATALLLFGLWFGMRGTFEEDIPLEPLLAAHSRYAADALVPEPDPGSSNFVTHLAEYHGSR